MAKKSWTLEEAQKIFNLPFPELCYTAQTIHRKHFNPIEIQTSTLLNIKSGGWSENCTYCAQSVHYSTGLKKEPLLCVEEVIAAAQVAKKMGSMRFCMGAVGRGPNEVELEVVCNMIREIKKLGLEACVTLGILTQDQVLKLKAAGLDYYNHNIDTSPEHYPNIVTTHTFQNRLDTIALVQSAGIKVCCGGIMGIGETSEDRLKMLVLLANLEKPPESIPINKLIKIPCTPLENAKSIDSFDLVRIIALARIMMSNSYVRLAAGRSEMSEELQALCFLVGANSIFYGEKLLTVKNYSPKKDDMLLQKLDLQKQGTRIQEELL